MQAREALDTPARCHAHPTARDEFSLNRNRTHVHAVLGAEGNWSEAGSNKRLCVGTIRGGDGQRKRCYSWR